MFRKCASELVNIMGRIKKPEQLLKPINVPSKLLLGPGPSNCSPRVLAAGALPLLGHLHSEFCQIMDEVKMGLQYVFQTNNAVTLAVSGTGHCAMETALFNLLEPNDTVLVAVHGVWGQRVTSLCQRSDVNVKTISKTPGQAFSLSEIENGLREHRPNVFFMCHSESSTGVMQPLEDIGFICHKYGCLLLVDTVASLGAVPIPTDDLGIDVIYSGSQKVLSAPPGVSLISFNEQAMSKVKHRKTPVQSFYLDMVELANYWGCYDEPRRYHHTGPITGIYQLREALSIIVEEGLENVMERHSECSKMLRDGLDKLGLELFVQDEALRLPTVTTVVVSKDVDWKEVANYCMKRYRLEISGGLGPTAGKVWRIGLMGYNCTPSNVNYVLRVLAEALEFSKTNVGKSKL